MKKTFLLFFCVILLISLFSCSPKISIVIKNNSSVDMGIEIDTGKTVESTIRALGGLDAENPLFESDLVVKSFSSAGLLVNEIKYPSSAGISINASSPSLQDALSAAPEIVRQDNSEKGHSIEIVLNKKNLKDIMSFMPQESMDYIDLLMAPSFTDEQMSQSEYLELIGIVYGKTLEDEMKNAVLELSVKIPGIIKEAKVSSIKVGRVEYKKDIATFYIPISYLLTEINNDTVSILWE